MSDKLLQYINNPTDLRKLETTQLPQLAKELRDFIIDVVAVKEGHLGASLGVIEIYPELMPDWQRVIKRAIDISLSIFVMILLSPLYLFAALKVKLSSTGSIFYKQERIGLHGKPFYIYKYTIEMLNLN